MLLFVRNKGVVLLACMIMLCICSVFAVGLSQMAGTNLQIAANHQKINQALAAAESGLQCAGYVVGTLTLPETGYNYVRPEEADEAWILFCRHLQEYMPGGASVSGPVEFTESGEHGEKAYTSTINIGNGVSFSVSFLRYDEEPYTIKVVSVGQAGNARRRVGIEMLITKDSSVLNYAVATRGRMWLTGDSTIHGSVFSSWDRADISPFNMTSDSQVNGTINTVISKEQIQSQDYQLETLDPNGNPVFDENGHRVYSPEDEIQAQHEGINYGQSVEHMPGMDIGDYDTDCYNTSDLQSIPPADYTVTEFFPHAAGDYGYPRDGSPRRTWNLKLDRQVYEGKHFTDAYLPDNYDALFRNCTFDGILYIDCAKSTSGAYNNVRFEDCTFNGTIVTDVPQEFKWQRNCLYFTGSATFDNQAMEEATILAPHFNVNLGNTNPVAGEQNELTGAVVGGIVDVRGNARIYGTIISMCDTTQWSSGYVTNIGATLGDGGSETSDPGDVGVIDIIPDRENLLPSGIRTPIVIEPQQQTYVEGF